ncbi:MAG: hypothetical protein ACYDC1_01495 [Limisphaerales bacterium]
MKAIRESIRRIEVVRAAGARTGRTVWGVLAVTAMLVRASEPAGEPLAAPFFDNLGDLHHPVTALSAKAQRYFDQGLTLCYAFNHQEAIRSFRAAAKLDPSCAMAYWGEAYAFGPHVNKPMTEEDNAQAWPHNLHFLWWSLVFEGRSVEALSNAEKVAAYARDNYCGPSPALEAPRFRHLPWLTLARFGRWDELLQIAEPPRTNDFLVDRALWHFTRGLA